MPKRRRLLTPVKSKVKSNANKQEVVKLVSEKEVSTPRGRLKGALLDALEPAEDSDTSQDQGPVKRERKEYSSEEEDRHNTTASPPRQSYVLKLFDRSVDLSQFNEDSPLYPICRAWMINQPKANYKDLGNIKTKPSQSEHIEDSVELPGPEGDPVSRVPSLTPEQMTRNKDNINLNYREAVPPSREELLQWHSARWAGVRAAWLQQGARVEARYHAAQRVLNKINVNAI